MTNAVMSQVDAAFLPKAERRWMRNRDPAVAKQTGRMLWSTPFHALVEARMRKTLIEMECQTRSCGAWSGYAGKAGSGFLVGLRTKIATGLSSAARSLTSLLSAPAPRAAAPPNVLRLPPRAPETSHPQASQPSQADPASLRMWAQGDILIERIDDVPAAGDVTEIVDADIVILARGELGGRRHRIHGRVRLFHAAALAHDIPKDLYVGHLFVKAGPARLEHDQHDAITLQEGTYRVRCQRRLDPSDASIVED